MITVLKIIDPRYLYSVLNSGRETEIRYVFSHNVFSGYERTILKKHQGHDIEEKTFLQTQESISKFCLSRSELISDEITTTEPTLRELKFALSSKKNQNIIYMFFRSPSIPSTERFIEDVRHEFGQDVTYRSGNYDDIMNTSDDCLLFFVNMMDLYGKISSEIQMNETEAESGTSGAEKPAAANVYAIEYSTKDILESCQHYSEVLSLKNNDESHAFKEEVDRFIKALEEFLAFLEATDVTQKTNYPLIEEKQNKLIIKIEKFLNGTKKICSNVDEISESPTGAFILTSSATLLLSALINPTGAFLFAGGLFGKSHLPSIEKMGKTINKIRSEKP